MAAYQLGLAFDDSEVVVLERDGEGGARGWGFSLEKDIIAFEDASPYWDLRGIRAVRGREHFGVRAEVAMSAVSRARLTDLLVEYCRSAGVDLRFATDGAALTDDELRAFDVVVAADGANSAMRRRFRERFEPVEIEHGSKFIWLGIDRPSSWVEMLVSEPGTVPAMAWCYGHAPDCSTAIVEMRAQDWLAAGFDRIPLEASVERIAEAFTVALAGARFLRQPGLGWNTFRLVGARRWVHGNIALLGDAAATKHFSLGLATTQALQHAALLVDCLAGAGDVARGLAAYEATGRPAAAALQQQTMDQALWVLAVLDRLASGDDAGLMRYLGGP
jgi:anthraniloyl-CoA monooxygenase